MRLIELSQLQATSFQAKQVTPVHPTVFSLRSVSLALVVLASTLSVQTAWAQGRGAPPVTVAKPIEQRITQWDEFSGRFDAIESVDVRARVSGFVEEIHFNDGELITKGDLLFSIDKRPFEIEVASAKATIDQRKAEVSLQISEVERAKPLVRRGAVTERDLEQREANLAVARAQLAAAEATLRRAELNLKWADVRAPISGRASDRRVDVGALISGGQTGGEATVLTRIVSLDPIHFSFDASETDYLRYVRLSRAGKRDSSRETGNPVRIKLVDEEGWPWDGKMNFIDNRLNPRSGTIRGRAIVGNPDKVLAPGLFGRMQLFGGELDALIIPDKAVVADQTRKIVFAIGDNNTIVAKPVKLGVLREGGLRVIESGITADDRIVIDGIANPAVRPGATVTPEDGTIATPADATGEDQTSKVQ
ncbi:MAG: efflux RND transporter periplasmic adaptor subunit [Pseudomonadota bacterium]